MSKGHWPKGKTRSDANPQEWRSLRLKLVKFIAKPERTGKPSKLRRSGRGLADYLGVNSRNVSRWIHSQRVPLAKYVRDIAKWMELVNGRKNNTNRSLNRGSKKH